MFSRSQIIENFQIEVFSFCELIKETEKLYEKHNNPYHNFKHGFLVLKNCYNFLIDNEILYNYFNILGHAALLFGALMHDIEHTGHNNMFEVNSLSTLAIRYNDESVLENHHAATAFNLLTKKNMNIFEKMHFDDFELFRKFVIRGIIHTDIKLHFSDLAEFSEKLNSAKFNPQEDQEDLSDFLLLFGILTHTADLYVPTLGVDSSVKWSFLVNEEFRSQVKLEKAKDLPITKFYQGLDDIKIVAKSELFFGAKIVKPLWLELDRFFQGQLSLQIENINESLKFWERVSDSEGEELERYKIKVFWKDRDPSLKLTGITTQSNFFNNI